MITSNSFFKALSDETRLNCLLLLTRREELCVCEMVEALQLSQPLVSRHLAQMRNASIVEDERRGQWVHYRLHQDLPSWAVEILEIVYSAYAESPALYSATARLQDNLPRPAGKCDS